MPCLTVVDAVLVTRSVYSFVELSCSPVFRRQWPSIYEALEDGNLSKRRIDAVVYQTTSSNETNCISRRSYGLVKAWGSDTSSSVPTSIKLNLYQGQNLWHWGKDIVRSPGFLKQRVVGHYPYYMSGLQVSENAIEKAAAQLRLVCKNLPTRPLSLWDAEYGCASFVKQTSDIAADKLMRSRTKSRSLQCAPTLQRYWPSEDSWE